MGDDRRIDNATAVSYNPPWPAAIIRRLPSDGHFYVT